MPVDTVHQEYEDTLPKWERCRDTFSGSDAVKAKDHKYLPDLESHTAVQYSAYKKRTSFYNAMRATVMALAGAVFHKALSSDVPDAVKPRLADVTLSSQSIDLFALNGTAEVLTVGRWGILTEMAEDASGVPMPYLCNYSAENIINWRTRRIGGERVLTRVVLMERPSEVDPKDEFAYVEIEQVRVLSLDDEGFYSVQLWRRNPKKTQEWLLWGDEIQPTRRAARLDFIPFEFVPGIDVVDPPMLDLADMNLYHYTFSADYANAMHFTGQPSIWIAGAAVNDDGEAVDMGSSTITMLGPEGSMGIIQADGKNAEGLRDLLRDTEGRMATLGARMLEQQAPHQETAHAVRMRHAGEHATLRTVAASVEHGLSNALRTLVWWSGEGANVDDVEASIELNKDFFGMTMSAEDLNALMVAVLSGKMSFDTMYHNLQRGNLTRPGVDAGQEQLDIGTDGSQLPLGGE